MSFPLKVSGHTKVLWEIGVPFQVSVRRFPLGVLLFFSRVFKASKRAQDALSIKCSNTHVQRIRKYTAALCRKLHLSYRRTTFDI